MAVPTSITDLSTTAASNSPAGSDSIGTSLDDFLRSIQAILKQTQSQGTDITAAATITPLSDGHYFTVNGSTGITAIGSANSWNGREIVLRFASTPTITHNGSSLILPGASNITAAAGDVATFVQESSGVWRCIEYVVAAATPGSVANGAITLAKLASSVYGTSANQLVQLDGSAKLPAVDGSQLTGISSGLTGFRNRIINGDMRIDQRNSGAAQTFTAGAALAYCVDRFYGYCTGANVTGQRVAGTSPNEYNYRFTGAASVTKIGFAQRIEATNSQDLASNTATLAVDLANSLLTTVTWTAWYANTADTFGTIASPTRTQIATGTFTVNSTLTRYSTQITVPAGATTGIEIEFSVGAQTSGTFTIGRVQLEKASSATAFEVRPIGFELAQCQRYYRVLRNGAYGDTCAATQISTGASFLDMRVAPTAAMLVTNPSFYDATAGGTGTASGASIAASSISPSSVTLIIGGFSALTAGHSGYISTDNFASLSAEL